MKYYGSKNRVCDLGTQITLELEYLDGQKLSDYLAKTYFDKEQAVPSSAAKEIMS